MITTRTNRGMSVVKLDVCPSKTTGILFQKCQTDGMASLPQTTVLSTKRGTATMRVSEYPKIESKTPNWGFVTVAKGTETRKL
ncbi:MAG: hypothetical protein ACR2LL_03825 [Nitrosopumilus sp.]